MFIPAFGYGIALGPWIVFAGGIIGLFMALVSGVGALARNPKIYKGGTIGVVVGMMILISGLLIFLVSLFGIIFLI